MRRSTKRCLLSSITLGLLVALGLSSSALAVHPRPGSATPTRVALVSAFAACGAPGSVHIIGAPSCAPPAPETGLTTSAAVGFGFGFVRTSTFCTNGEVPPCPAAGDQEDIAVSGTVTDVECAAAVPAAGCPAAGADYGSPVMYQLPVRITDHASGPPPFPPPPCGAPGGGPPCTTATVIDALLQFPVACAPAGAPGAPPGSACPFATTVDTVRPGTIIENQIMSIRFFDEVQVLDVGPDGAIGGPMCPPLFCGSGDEGITRAAGQFAP